MRLESFWHIQRMNDGSCSSSNCLRKWPTISSFSKWLEISMISNNFLIPIEKLKWMLIRYLKWRDSSEWKFQEKNLSLSTFFMISAMVVSSNTSFFVSRTAPKCSFVEMNGTWNIFFNHLTCPSCWIKRSSLIKTQFVRTFSVSSSLSKNNWKFLTSIVQSGANRVVWTEWCERKDFFKGCSSALSEWALRQLRFVWNKRMMQALANTKTLPFPVYLEMKPIIPSEPSNASMDIPTRDEKSRITFQFGQTFFPLQTINECKDSGIEYFSHHDVEEMSMKCE